MIAYYGRFGNYLGQASAVPAEAPLTRVPPPVTPVVPVIAPAPVADVPQDWSSRAEEKVSYSKAALAVGGLALVGVTLAVSGAFSRRR